MSTDSSSISRITNNSSSMSRITANNGSFTITTANGTETVDLGTLIMMLNLERTQLIDKQIEDALMDIQQRNERISEMTEFMAICRNKKSEGVGSDQLVKNTGAISLINPNALVTINGKTMSMEGWATEFGITWTDCSGSRSSAKDKDAWDAAWDANINAIKGKIDILNNDSQIANIKLQNLLEKRGNSFEMATQVMDTNNQSIQSILRNL